jgi:hypothetical protein
MDYYFEDHEYNAFGGRGSGSGLIRAFQAAEKSSGMAPVPEALSVLYYALE